MHREAAPSTVELGRAHHSQEPGSDLNKPPGIEAYTRVPTGPSALVPSPLGLSRWLTKYIPFSILLFRNILWLPIALGFHADSA